MSEWVPPEKTPRFCDISACEKAHYAKGLCQSHYMRWRKYGNPLAGQRLLGKASVREDKPLEEVASQLREEKVVQINETKFGSPDEWVYIRESGRWLRKSTNEMLHEQTMKSVYGPGIVQLLRDGTVKDYQGICFINPRQHETPKDYYNVWKLPEMMETDALLEPLLPENKILLENLGAEHVDYLKDWIAFGFRHPGDTSCALILHGVSGSGKSTLAMLLREIYKDLATTVNINAIQSEFNPWLERKLLIVAEEITISNLRDRERVANMMKTWVVGGEVPINKKNVPQYNIQNLSRWLIFSNDRFPVPIDEDDRRYSVIKQSGKIDPDLGRYLYDDRERFARNLYNHLGARAVEEDFQPMRPLQNDDRKAIMQHPAAVVSLR